MKIFLNNRTIEFISVMPAVMVETDFVIEFESLNTLVEAWNEFKRIEKYQRFLIVDTGITDIESGRAFEAFYSIFKFVPAAGGLVKNENGAFLFIHRLGFWDLPKGKVDKKDKADKDGKNLYLEASRAAAIREVMEETGLKKVEIVKEMSSTWHIYTVKEKWILKQTRWFEMEADSQQQLTPETREGIFLVKWVPPEAMQCIVAHTYASIKELLTDVMLK